ncbi:MAG: aldehyde ferredoxin oxidoreductase C-terminal domain-containing protein, partial [Chloroflexota bacterium]
SRANTLARAFNVREGIRSRDDVLPARFAEAMTEGATAGQRIMAEDLAAARAEFYRVSGWSADGVPTEARLRELGLEHVAAQLEGL